MENISIKKVKFNTGAADFIMSTKDWIDQGGYKGFLKDNSISSLDIQEVVNDQMTIKDYNSLSEWDG